MNNRQLFMIGGAAVVVILIIAAAFLILPGSMGAGNHIILASLNNDGDVDLSMLRFGDDLREATELVEDAQLFGCEFYVIDDDDIDRLPLGMGFIPGRRAAIFCTMEDGEYQVMQIDIGDEEPTELLEADGPVTGYIYPQRDQILLVEDRGDQERCYVSRDGEPAERIAKEDTCEPVLDGSAVLTAEYDSDGLTLALTDVRRGDEVELFDEEPRYTEYRLSYDGSRIALLSDDDGDISIDVMDTRDGEIIASSDEYVRVLRFGFAAREDRVFGIAENEDGELVLLVQNANSFDEIVEAERLQAEANETGRYLVYQTTDDDGESEIGAYDIARGNMFSIYSGEQISFALAEGVERVLILEQDEEEYMLYSVPFNGGDALELLSMDDIYGLDPLTYSDDERLFIAMYSEDGTSLYVSSTTRSDAFLLLEEWDSFDPLQISPNGRTLIFEGMEDDGDDLTLYAISLSADSQPVELDDDMEEMLVELAMFSSNGREFVYSVRTGSDSDDIEVRTVRVNGDETPEELYDEAVLIAAGWNAYSTFDGLAFTQTLSGVGVSGGSTPDGDITISGSISSGQTISDQISNAGGDYWVFNGDAGDRVVISLIGTNGLDPVVELLDENFNTIDTDDDGGEGLNSLLQITLPYTGQYIIRARGWGGETGSYRLSLGVGTAATQEEPAQAVSGTIRIGQTINDRVSSDEGDYWSFNGQAGDTITILLTGTSGMDTVLELMDSSFDRIEYDDDGGEGLNSRIDITLPYTGEYIIRARGFSGRTGPYELSLFAGTVPTPTVRPTEASTSSSIRVGETVQERVTNSAGDSWSLTLESGDIVIIAMDAVDNLDTYLELQDPSGNVLITNDDGGEGFNSRILVQVPRSGTYTIIARGFSGDTGGYTLSVEDISASLQGTLRYNRTISDSISQEDEVDLWTFEGEAGDIITVTMEGPGSLDPYLTVYNEEFVQIAADDDGGAGTDAATFFSMLPDSGTYYVSASAFNGTGQYTLTVNRYAVEDQPVREAGDSFNRTFTDTIGNIDLVRGTSGDVISIAMNAIDDLDPVMGIFDRDWNLLVSDDDSGEGLNALISGFEFPYTGDYYLVTISLGDELGDYSLEIFDGVIEPAN